MAKKSSEIASSSSTSATYSSSGATQRKPLIEIPEDEQQRLVKHTGILKKVRDGPNVEYIEEVMTLPDEIFNAILYIVPFSFLLLMMEVLIHQQYRQTPSVEAILDRMTPGIPIMSIFIFYTLRYKHYRTAQVSLFAVSIVASTRMIYLINRASYKINMRQDPPLAVLWIHTIVHLDLGPAILSLLTTGSFVWWKGLKLFF